MFCRAIFSEDGLEYEGELKEINVSDGHQYAIVEFLGYGNQETVWTDQLMESAGAKARKAQIDEALAGESEVAPAEKEEDVVVEKIEKTEVLAPKVQEFQSPEVEQPNDDRIQMPDSIEGGAQGWVAWLTDDPLGLTGVHEEDRCRLVGGLIAIGIIIFLMIVILCMSFKLLGFESYLF